MRGSKEPYIIIVHFPKSEEDKQRLREKMGAAYLEIVRDYILTLPMDENEKNEIFEKIIHKLRGEG